MEKWSLTDEKQQCDLMMDLKEEGLDGWHRRGKRLFQGDGKADMKDDRGSAWMEKLSRKHNSISKTVIGRESRIQQFQPEES